MSSNGNRRPPRPRIEMVTAGASATETAAVIAAVEQFLADTAPAPPPSTTRQNPWQRAALEEGIAARQLTGDAWGHAPRLPGRLG